MKLISKSLNVILIVFLGISSGCQYKIYKDSAGKVQTFEISKEQKARLSYAYIMNRIFLRNCVSCHGKSSSLNLESYPEVVAQLSKIKLAVFVDHSMPKNSVLTSDELSELWNWIELGAPEKSQTGIAEPPPEPIEATFSSIDKNIFQVSCVKCHAPEKSASSVLLTREELMDSPRDLVLPGNANESGLVLSLERKDGKRMPPAKKGYEPLKPEQLKAIREWISQGAVN